MQNCFKIDFLFSKFDLGPNKIICDTATSVIVSRTSTGNLDILALSID